MPKDTLQLYAAKELYNRVWKYHKEIKLWFIKSVNCDTSIINDTTQPSEYIYFDINSWTQKYWDDTQLLHDTTKFMNDTELTSST